MKEIERTPCRVAQLLDDVPMGSGAAPAEARRPLEEGFIEARSRVISVFGGPPSVEAG